MEALLLGQADHVKVRTMFTHVRAFGGGNETPLGTIYGVNVMCIDDVSDEELARVPITYVDGRADRWQDAPLYFSHL